MAYENVRIPTSPDCPNFCICPRSASEFCYVDHVNGVLRIVRTSDGAVQTTYTLSNGVGQIASLEYAGPRNLGGSFSGLGDELPFFTLEHVSSTNCEIKRWKLNNTDNTLDWQETISLTGSNYDCYDMAVEHYETSFNGATTTGTGQIDLTLSSGIEVGDSILLGPSGDTDNLNAFEYVTVTGVIGNTIYFDGAKPDNEYVDGDPVTFYKHAYVFSDVGQGAETNKGSLYGVNLNNSTILGVGDSGIYSGVRAAAWSRDYQSVGFVKDTNILYLNTETYQIQKSQALTNINSDDVTILPVYDLVFDNTAIYRLQRATTLADLNGDKFTASWTTYNYQLDSISPYTKSIVLYTIPDSIILNDEGVTLVAVVRDQFGVGLSSKLVYFYDVPDSGVFTPVNGQATTNANGVASLSYTTNYFDPVNPGDDFINIAIQAKTNGGVVGITGHDDVWDGLELLYQRKFTVDLNDIIQKPTLSGTWPVEGSELYNQISITQILGMENEFNIKCLTKFQFPGGDWVSAGPPTATDTTILKQILNFESESSFDQISAEVENELPVIQDKDQTNDLQISQLYVSKHSSFGHKDDINIEQFRFIEDAIPAFWSEKNPVNTNIWIRLRPFAFDLNQSTLVFKVREVSYAGDTGYTDVTSLCTITTFDAGGGLDGLDILYDPSVDFHNNAVIHVSIEVYDGAPIPNIILTDYWFRIIPDYRAPYIENEFPAREEEDVSIDTNISFDILDAGVGVDISSLEFYVNNRYKLPIISPISGGYHISYVPSEDFTYGQTVEITVNVKDASDYQNQLHDMWRFYCEGSAGPWIDPDSFYPKNCVKGTYRKLTGISANVYGISNTGVDQSSILVKIGGKERNVTITPIIYRID
jgi:hypothetical protein